MKKLFKSIDNAPLILFRIFFGILFALESFGAITTGWVKANFITPQFTFSHIGFEWLQPLPGYGMYAYFIVMGIFSIFVALGYRYRLSIIILTTLWAGTYLMQKTSYNNHYYLLLLVGIMLAFLPANSYKSLDVKQGRTPQKLSMPFWCVFVMIAQIAIVYFYATVAKFYPDWLDGTFIKNLLANSTPFEAINNFFSQKWFYMFITYMGIVFDGLIVPALLYKRTRNIAVIASLVFHLFNSVVLQIGIFPYFALSYAVFFYEPETIRRIFFKNKPKFESIEQDYSGKQILKYFFLSFLCLQVLLPLRHWFIKGDVLFTEEGHRLSWRMMLRSKSGYTSFKLVDKATNQKIPFVITNYITPKQYNSFATKPDMIWQLAQRINKIYKERDGIDVAVYATTYVSVNGKPSLKLIDDTVDLTQVDWNYFGHSEWVLLPEQYK